MRYGLLRTVVRAATFVLALTSFSTAFAENNTSNFGNFDIDLLQKVGMSLGDVDALSTATEGFSPEVNGGDIMQVAGWPTFPNVGLVGNILNENFGACVRHWNNTGCIRRGSVVRSVPHHCAGPNNILRGPTTNGTLDFPYKGHVESCTRYYRGAFRYWHNTGTSNCGCRTDVTGMVRTQDVLSRCNTATASSLIRPYVGGGASCNVTASWDAYALTCRIDATANRNQANFNRRWHGYCNNAERDLLQSSHYRIDRKDPIQF